MAWLKIDQTLRDHHKICDAADELQVDPAHMTGMMVLFWLWAIDNAPSGSLAGVSAGTIARGAQYGGDPIAFVEALKQQELLDEGPEGLQIHDWEEHAGNLIDRRQKDAKRKAAERAAKKAAEPETSEGHPQDVREKSAPRVEQSKSRERVEKNNTPPDGGESEPADPIPFEKLRILWNETCLSYSKANGVNGNRRTLLAARWKEHADLDWWAKYFARIEASAFLKGKNDRKWKATLDWILNAANMDKILEGKYDEKEGGGQHGPDTDQRPAGDYTRGFKE